MTGESHITHWGSEDCVTSSEELTEFVKSLVPRGAYTGREVRVSVRHPLFADLQVQPVGADYRPFGAQFSAVTRDISVGGLGLISPVLVATPLLIVRIDHPHGFSKCLLMEVRRCRPFRKYFEVGGPFVTDVS